MTDVSSRQAAIVVEYCELDLGAQTFRISNNGINKEIELVSLPSSCWPSELSLFGDSGFPSSEFSAFSESNKQHQCVKFLKFFR